MSSTTRFKIIEDDKPVEGSAGTLFGKKVISTYNSVSHFLDTANTVPEVDVGLIAFKMGSLFGILYKLGYSGFLDWIDNSCQAFVVMADNSFAIKASSPTGLQNLVVVVENSKKVTLLVVNTSCIEDFSTYPLSSKDFKIVTSFDI